MAIIDATFRKSPHYNWDYALLVPHSPRMVPQARLRCLRQLETLLKRCDYLCEIYVY